MTNIEYNQSRLDYLLSLYRLSKGDMLRMASEGLKKNLTQQDLSNPIKIAHLKRIDRIFNKGIAYYLDPKEIVSNAANSVFFRKDQFNTELNIGAKKIVNQFEEIKTSVSALSKLSNIEIARQLESYQINNDPKEVAYKVRAILYPDFTNNLRDFLKALIEKLADNNILVFEFVETWNKKEKANINGCFIKPNTIILKRQQQALRREIFTLAHELGHYLLDQEELEEVDYIDSRQLSAVENWCNDFAYFFLSGDYDDQIQSLKQATENNNYLKEKIETLSENTHLSRLAIYTKLLYLKKISSQNYDVVKTEMEKKHQEKIKEQQRDKERKKQFGIKTGGSTPKPIISPLYLYTLQTALYDGTINEYDFCQRLKIQPKEIGEYI